MKSLFEKRKSALNSSCAFNCMSEIKNNIVLHQNHWHSNWHQNLIRPITHWIIISTPFLSTGWPKTQNPPLFEYMKCIIFFVFYIAQKAVSALSLRGNKFNLQYQSTVLIWPIHRDELWEHLIIISHDSTDYHVQAIYQNRWTVSMLDVVLYLRSECKIIESQTTTLTYRVNSSHILNPRGVGFG